MLPYDAERVFADAVSSVQWVRTDEVLNRCLETAKTYFVRFANKHNWCEDEARSRARLMVHTAAMSASEKR